jgi:hypothetical protein
VADRKGKQDRHIPKLPDSQPVLLSEPQRFVVFAAAKAGKHASSVCRVMGQTGFLSGTDGQVEPVLHGDGLPPGEPTLLPRADGSGGVYGVALPCMVLYVNKEEGHLYRNRDTGSHKPTKEKKPPSCCVNVRLLREAMRRGAALLVAEVSEKVYAGTYVVRLSHIAEDDARRARKEAVLFPIMGEENAGDSQFNFPLPKMARLRGFHVVTDEHTRLDDDRTLARPARRGEARPDVALPAAQPCPLAEEPAPNEGTIGLDDLD